MCSIQYPRALHRNTRARCFFFFLSSVWLDGPATFSLLIKKSVVLMPDYKLDQASSNLLNAANMACRGVPCSEKIFWFYIYSYKHMICGVVYAGGMNNS